MIIPEYISLRDWAASLIVDFPADNLPILYNEEEWKDWGNDVILSPSFERTNAPRTDSYSEWSDWAKALYQTSGFIQG